MKDRERERLSLARRLRWSTTVGRKILSGFNGAEPKQADFDEKTGVCVLVPVPAKSADPRGPETRMIDAACADAARPEAPVIAARRLVVVIGKPAPLTLLRSPVAPFRKPYLPRAVFAPSTGRPARSPHPPVVRERRGSMALLVAALWVLLFV
jgi:hypothetical protein